MAKTIGYMRCPVCGRKTDLRENKNGVLYTYCGYNHHSKLNREDSTAAKAAINAGQSWNNGIIYLYPNERKIDNGTDTGTTGTNTATTSYGRIYGQSATDPTVTSRTTDTAANDEWDGDCGMF